MRKYSHTERRSGQDRREKHIPFYKLLSYDGNRQMLRRTDDRKRIVLLDHYQPTLLISVMIVLCLSLLDGTLTLLLLEKGAVELNPVMRYYLTLGPMTFVMAKYGLTVLALLIFVVLHTHNFTQYRIGIYLLPFCKITFGSVVIWEIYLLTR